MKTLEIISHIVFWIFAISVIGRNFDFAKYFRRRRYNHYVNDIDLDIHRSELEDYIHNVEQRLEKQIKKQSKQIKKQ